MIIYKNRKAIAQDNYSIGRQYKYCSKCASTLNEKFFGRNRTSYDRLQSYCLKCCNESAKEYYWKHKIIENQKTAEYHRSHPEIVKICNQNMWKRHRQDLLKRFRKWREQHPGYMARKSKEWRDRQ